MLFKAMAHLVYMSIQKFSIVTVSQTQSVGVKGSTAIVPLTKNQDSIKKMLKFLQNYIQQTEGCEHAIVYFQDFSSNQLYTIAYAEDEDFESTSISLIKEQKKKVDEMVKSREKEILGEKPKSKKTE